MDENKQAGLNRPPKLEPYQWNNSKKEIGNQINV